MMYEDRLASSLDPLVWLFWLVCILQVAMIGRIGQERTARLSSASVGNLISSVSFRIEPAVYLSGFDCLLILLVVYCWW
jgi:hypothetical protein